MLQISEILVRQSANLVGYFVSTLQFVVKETGASIKVYEDCCPFSQERVFRINGTPEVLVEVVRRILDIVQESSTVSLTFTEF